MEAAIDDGRAQHYPASAVGGDALIAHLYPPSFVFI
jgi:hypothetical protein